MRKLDGIFNRDDVVVLCFIDQIDDRGERGTFAAAGRAGNEHDPILQLDDVAQLRRQIEILKSRRPFRNHTHYDRMRSALFEYVDAKTTETRNTERQIR